MTPYPLPPLVALLALFCLYLVNCTFIIFSLSTCSFKAGELHHSPAMSNMNAASDQVDCLDFLVPSSINQSEISTGLERKKKNILSLPFLGICRIFLGRGAKKIGFCEGGSKDPQRTSNTLISTNRSLHWCYSYCYKLIQRFRVTGVYSDYTSSFH